MLNKDMWYKILAFLLVMTFVVPVLAACGDNDEEPAPTTSTAASTVNATVTSVTPSPAATAIAGPVKLGGICSWSGPTAMSGLSFADPCIKLVEQQVKDQGGILGGREVKVVRFDNRGSVAEAQAGVKKLVEDDNVSAIVFGGVSATEQLAVAEVAEQYKILHCALALSDYKGQYALAMGPSRWEIQKVVLYSAINIEKSQTVAFLSSDIEDSRSRIGEIKGRFTAAGVKVVYESYAPVDTMDFTPYLTKIKYEKPEYLYIEFSSSEPYITVAKQITELGGWGDIKVGCLPSAESATRQSGTDGWYVLLFWFPGSTYPGSVKFETGIKSIIGRTPSASHVYFYMCLWTAIRAIEMAGTDTDREAIVRASRSGKLEWESPAGLVRWNGTDQFSDLGYQLARVEGGKLVQVPVTE